MQFALMKALRYLFLLFFILSALFSFSQRSKDGAKVISTANNIVNEYTTLSANAAAGATTLSVANSTLNANGRFPGALAAGDLLMIIQIQGADILGQQASWNTNIGDPVDSTWGEITNYNNCGNWEFAEVYSVPNGTSITLDCPLTNNYTSAGRVVVIRVPRYSSLTVNAGGSVTCDPWNGSIGGICSIEIENNTTINAGGSIDVTGKGFRGGQLLEDSTNWGVPGVTASQLAADGAEKGEGIAGYQSDYNPHGGRYCKGAGGNAGGGGNAHNAGGGGGANGGNILLWNGHGIPDNSGPSWNLAWNLQYPGFSTQTSSGGGQGGYTFSNTNLNATTAGPNNTNWNGDQRRSCGGIGGRPLDYSTGRLFLGGGGGSGDQNDNDGGAGGNGGALIYLMNYGTVSGAGQIISNGNVGVNATGTSPPINGYVGADGAGGAGAGGTIIINSVGNISGVSITANGGKGGDQVIVKGAFAGTVVEAEGPGGGGSGGYIAISIGAPVRTTNGGANGTTNSGALTEFLPNGATQGDAGTNNATVTNFIINSPNVTICAGQSATLNATLSGTIPGGTTILWYNQLVAGNVLGTGNTYTTPVLSAGTYTFYVGTCPGTYHQPVIVTVTSSPAVSAGPDVTICNGGNTTLSASGGTGYAWSPPTGLNNPNISNPIANPVSTTTYVVTVTSSCGNANDTVVVTVNSSLTASISGNLTICTGGNTTLTASGGNNYLWSTTATTSSIVVSPTTNTTYSVTVTNGSCSSTTSVTVTIGSSLTASISGNLTICTGGNTTLTASGGGNYLWNTGQTTVAVAVAAAGTYSVIVTIGSCSDTASATVNVSPAPSASVTATSTSICGGASTTLSATGGSSFSWSNGATGASISVTPATTTTYTVTASNGACTDTAIITVNVTSPPTATILGVPSICSGAAATLTATGGGTYAWSTTETTSIINLTTPGTYSVVVTNGSCSDTEVVTVSSVPNPTAGVSPDITIAQGQSTNLSASGGNTYSWDNSMNGLNITVSPQSTTVYCVTVYANGCQDTECVTVFVELCSKAGTLYLPNAFSPNGDGDNDSLQIYYGIPECIKTLHLVLYNRWGEKVFETDDRGFRWSGVYNSGLLKEAQKGATEVFAYYMEAEIADGSRVSKKGNISLVK